MSIEFFLFYITYRGAIRAQRLRKEVTQARGKVGLIRRSGMRMVTHYLNKLLD